MPIVEIRRLDEPLTISSKIDTFEQLLDLCIGKLGARASVADGDSIAHGNPSADVRIIVPPILADQNAVASPVPVSQPLSLTTSATVPVDERLTDLYQLGMGEYTSE